jgi:hypothetical protein
MKRIEYDINSCSKCKHKVGSWCCHLEISGKQIINKETIPDWCPIPDENNILKFKNMKPEIKKLLEEIEETGEPIFIVRANDALAQSTIGAYQQMCQNDPQIYTFNNSFMDEFENINEEFREWERTHLEYIRTPDLELYFKNK